MFNKLLYNNELKKMTLDKKVFILCSTISKKEKKEVKTYLMEYCGYRMKGLTKKMAYQYLEMKYLDDIKLDQEK